MDLKIKNSSMLDRNKMKQNVKKLSLYISIIVAFIACQEKTEQAPLIRPVKVEKVGLNTFRINKLVLPASINELRETKLSFRVGGPLIKLNDVIGSHVNAGEVIAKIDPRDFIIAIEATESRYKLAKAEYERYKKLARQGSVSKSVFDQMETNYKLAKTDFESATNAMDDTELKAPFSGFINSVFANNFEEIVPGSPIVSLLDMSKFEVNAWVSVKDAALINQQTKFTCIVKQGKSDVRISGKLKEIGNKTSLSKQALPISIVINASKNFKLRAGMASYLEIEHKRSQSDSTIQVPLTSIFRKDNKTKLWVYNKNSGTVSARLVNTGKVMDHGSIEIINGLSSDETIVSAGANYLFEGQKVKKMEGLSKSNIGNKL